jgi:hypothetical protein
MSETGDIMIYTALLKNAWKSLYDTQEEVIKTIDKFFHKDYEQCINGVNMNRNEYIHHVIEQKKNMTIDTIDYKHILEKENELFAIYYPEGKNINDLRVKAEVVAYFYFKNHQIFRIHGLVRLINGNLSDVDMQNTYDISS